MMKLDIEAKLRKFELKYGTTLARNQMSRMQWLRMASEPIKFTVTGTPQPAGSKSAAPYMAGGKMRVAVRDSNPRAKDWKNLVAMEAAKHVDGGGLLRGPLAVALRFFLVRPKGHYRTGRNAGLVKDGSPIFPTTKPDALKLARGVEDALKNVIYADDSQIVDEAISKQYGEPARVEITIQPLAQKP